MTFHTYLTFGTFGEFGPVEGHCCSPTEPGSSPRATALVSLLSLSQSRTELAFLLEYPRTGGSSGSALRVHRPKFFFECEVK